MNLHGFNSPDRDADRVQQPRRIPSAQPQIYDNIREVERQRKKEYQSYLQSQVEEKKKRKEQEKIQQREEDLMYEERFKQIHKEENTRGKKGNNIQSVTDTSGANQGVPSYKVQDGAINKSNNNPQSSLLNTEQRHQTNSNNSYTNIHNQQQRHVNNYPSQQMEITEEFSRYRDRALNKNEMGRSSDHQNQYINNPVPGNVANKGNYHFNSNNRDRFEPESTMPENSSADNQNYGQSVLPLGGQYNQDYRGNQNYPNMYNSPGHYNNPYNMMYPPYSGMPMQGMQPPFMIPSVFEDMMKQFFQEQLKMINQYKGKIDELSQERDNAIFQTVAAKEKILAMSHIKNEQEKFRDNTGFYPFNKDYNKDIEATLNEIIDVNFKKSSLENMIRNNPQSIKKSYADERPISGKPMSHKEEHNRASHNTRQKPEYNADLDYLAFRSKYEDLSNSTITTTNEELKNTLAGFSKFVAIEPRDQNEFLATWREDEYPVHVQTSQAQGYKLNDTLETEQGNPMLYSQVGRSYEEEEYYNPQVNTNRDDQSDDSFIGDHAEKQKVPKKQFIHDKSKSLNFPRDTEFDKYYNVRSQRDVTDMQQMRLSEEDKDRSIILDETEQFEENRPAEEEGVEEEVAEDMGGFGDEDDVIEGKHNDNKDSGNGKFLIIY